jgi:hypothetical protein
MQSAAFYLRLCLGFCFRFCLYFCFCFCGSLGNLDPCDAGVRGCLCACVLAVASVATLGLFTGRVGGSIGSYRGSILIVVRLYYRIICLGLFFLSLSLSLAFLFLFFLLLYIQQGTLVSTRYLCLIFADTPPFLARALSPPVPS